MSTVPDSPGGQGDDPPSRSELKLVEQALRQEWPIPAMVKRRLLQRMVNLVDLDPDDDAMASEDPDQPPMVPPANGTTPRTAIAAMRVIVAICNLSLKQQALDLARERFQGKEPEFDLATAVAKAEQLAEERRAQRELEDSERSNSANH